MEGHHQHHAAGRPRGVVTGVLLAVARIAGETAPLLFTALNNQFWTSSLSEPMASLPVTIFKFAMSPYENWQQLAWAGVFLITVAVLGLNILAYVPCTDAQQDLTRPIVNTITTQTSGSKIRSRT
jgi:ABC-type phosphate transport system permease subunit